MYTLHIAVTGPAEAGAEEEAAANLLASLQERIPEKSIANTEVFTITDLNLYRNATDQSPRQIQESVREITCRRGV